MRVPEDLRAAAERRAAAEGTSLSVLTREALEYYLASRAVTESGDGTVTGTAG